MATEEKKFLDKAGLEYYSSKFYTRNENDAFREYDDYYPDVTYRKDRYYDTDCYFTFVPLHDGDGNQIDLHVEANRGMTPTQYARANYTTLTTNATLTWKQSNDTYKDTIVIGDGEVLHEYDGETITADYLYYVGIKADRSISDYQVINTTSEDMLADGVQQAFMAFFRLVKDGEAVEQTVSVATTRNPRQCLGIKENKEIVFLTCDGRTERSVGLTAEECSQILIAEGCIDAWNLDGGGSASTTIEGSKLNSSIDNGGTADRRLNYSLNVRKTILNEAVARAYSKIGEEKMNIIAQLLNYSNAQFMQVAPDGINGKDLNTLVSKKYFTYGNNLVNSPDNVSGYFINIPHGEERFVGLYAQQIFIPRESGNIYTRQLLNGVFTSWRLANGTSKAFLFRQNPQSIQTSGSYEDLALTLSAQNYSRFVTPTNYDSGSTTLFRGFTVSGQRSFMIRLEAQLRAAVNGNKYIRIGRNGAETSPSVTRISGVVGDERVIVSEAVISYVSDEDVFSVQYYGSAGDSIERLKLIVEGF